MFTLYAWEGVGQWSIDGPEVNSYSIQWKDENNPAPQGTHAVYRVYHSSSVCDQNYTLIHQNEEEEIC